ncbi:MAG: pyridoxal-phosphate dependent enzyme [Deltaproteobacteria bacterium]|nr:pyridoxal-phosphate dependent enzyme [Deltaproteobacteria bacterium]
MSRQQLDKVSTIADSLGSPVTLPYSLAVCKKYIDELLLISDQDLVHAMKTIFSEFRMLVEPACAAGIATLTRYPEKFRGKRTVLLFCGSNTDVQTWVKQTGKSR